jgi:tetratricopeptide (TPR) repeat protein
VSVSEAGPAQPHALEIVLAAQSGESALDQRIRKQQQRVASSRTPARDLEPLGWTFVARARELNDPGSYQLALQTALAIEELAPGDRAGLLLRGHALHSLHRFREAEQVAQRLVSERGSPVDHGLLGDVLADRGELDAAAEAYQRMVDMRPDAHSYARGAHVRYMKGNLAGAIEAMRMAARAVSPRNRETFAWIWAKLAHYELESGALDAAAQSVQNAQQVFPSSFPAWRAEAAVWLARGVPERALAPLRAAAAASPHPDVLWMLAEALERAGRAPEAAEVRARLLEVGASEDPRAFALYLASTGAQLERAEQLVRVELTERSDPYTHEALAVVLSARGQHKSALLEAERALAHGTSDPRLHYHAGLIAERTGDTARAQRWFERAAAASQALLPSQREALAARVALEPSTKTTVRRQPTSGPRPAIAPEEKL